MGGPTSHACFERKSVLKELEYTFSTTIDFSIPVHDHYFVLRCMPSPSHTLRVLKSDLAIEPDMRYARQTDSFGNRLAVGCELEEHTHIGYYSSGVVQVDLDRVRLEQPHPMFKYPTELTRPDNAIVAFAESLGDATVQVDLCLRAMTAVHEAMAYEPGTTTVSTTAAEAFAAKQGVCQDFSHILIAMLRYRGVLARYVSGLALGEGQTHAWVEANIDGFWRGFDPTRNQQVDDTYIPLARGREWADCPIERGSFIGLADQSQTVFMTVKEHAEQ
ncbi:Uncharacterized protein conserved in bacteria [Slackia heliotrinireducens]|nr:Uncharacterized protein conserved in bacteria [Slackia heliotrinireducens]